ncbi:hypothetical protein ARAQ110984_04595 [Arcobacter aquimarinus]
MNENVLMISDASSFNLIKIVFYSHIRIILKK